MGKFVINVTNTGFTFHLKAVNGETIATGGEVYSSVESCKKGCESVIANAPVANLEDQTVEGYEEQKHPKFELYKDNADEFRFHLKAPNGQFIASSEGYVKKDSCKNGIESVRKNAADAPIILPEVEPAE
jgi:hypothetical protein